ncbi:MAG: hypothetical protein ABEI53_03565, partial [Candidatus Magasanikbacteria bacterium]
MPLIFEAVRILILFTLSFMVALFITPFVFKFLKKFDFRKKNIRSEERAPVFHEHHKEKSDTPTMGGIIIWGTVLGLAFIFLVLDNTVGGFTNYFNFVNRSQTYLPLAALFFSAIVGLVDDMFGILGKGAHEGGLSIWKKLGLYTAVAV